MNFIDRKAFSLRENVVTAAFLAACIAFCMNILYGIFILRLL